MISRIAALPLILSLMVAGCSSPDAKTKMHATEPEYAPSTGLCASPWGDLPTYKQPARAAVRSEFRPVQTHNLKGTVVVDILVNRDGTVREVAVVKSSGKPDVDAAAVARARAFRFAAKIHPDDPAPYVVPEIKLRFDTEDGPGEPVSYPYHTN